MGMKIDFFATSPDEVDHLPFQAKYRVYDVPGNPSATHAIWLTKGLDSVSLFLTPDQIRELASVLNDAVASLEESAA